MAFLLPYEGIALGIAASEGLAGIIAGAIAAIETHHHATTQDNTGGVAPDDDDPDPNGGGTEDDHPDKRDFVVYHSQTMEISRSNEVGVNPYREARWQRLRKGIHHVRKYGWEYSLSALSSIATGIYSYKRRYRQSMSQQERDFQQRAIRHGMLRHYAPHAVSGFETPLRTPTPVRKRRAHSHAFEGFRFTPRRF